MDIGVSFLARKRQKERRQRHIPGKISTRHPRRVSIGSIVSEIN